jgi:hypothetical protein
VAATIALTSPYLVVKPWALSEGATYVFRALVGENPKVRLRNAPQAGCCVGHADFPSPAPALPSFFPPSTPLRSLHYSRSFSIKNCDSEVLRPLG